MTVTIWHVSVIPEVFLEPFIFCGLFLSRRTRMAFGIPGWQISNREWMYKSVASSVFLFNQAKSAIPSSRKLNCIGIRFYYPGCEVISLKAFPHWSRPLTLTSEITKDRGTNVRVTGDVFGRANWWSNRSGSKFYPLVSFAEILTRR